MSNIFIGITHAILFFFWGFFAGGPEITTNAPATAKPGETFVVEVTVNKGEYKDFARLLQKLPEGFTASELENDGAKFLFENGEVKFIWYSAPGKNEIKVSYKVTVAPDASGDKQITGKYSYVESGNSASIPTNPVTINIGSGSTVATSGNDGGTNTTTSPVDTMAKPEAVVAIKRTMPADATDAFDVEVSIDKADLRGFAKLEETLPAGFTATAIETDGAKFETEGQKVKFTWFTLPTKNALRVSYKITVATGTSGDQPIAGLFSYVENEKGKNSDIAATTIKITPPAEPVATNTSGDGGNKTPDNGNTGTTGTTTANTNTTGNEENKTPVNGNTGTTTAGNTTTDSGNTGSTTASSGNTGNEENKTPVTSIPSAETGVSFRIQIAALARSAPASEFSNRFGISDRIDAEMHQGLNKYLIGSFPAYQDARNKREDIRGKGVSDAFVTAYNSGRRITVQEALMIGNQKWVR